MNVDPSYKDRLTVNYISVNCIWFRKVIGVKTALYFNDRNVTYARHSYENTLIDFAVKKYPGLINTFRIHAMAGRAKKPSSFLYQKTGAPAKRSAISFLCEKGHIDL